MKRMRKILWAGVTGMFLACAAHAGEIDPARKVTLMRVPGGGIQPQVAVDAAGTVHMVYYKGDPGHGDLYYVRSRNSERDLFGAAAREHNSGKCRRRGQYSRRSHRYRKERTRSRGVEWLSFADSRGPLRQGADAVHAAQRCRNRLRAATQPDPGRVWSRRWWFAGRRQYMEMFTWFGMHPRRAPKGKGTGASGWRVRPMTAPPSSARRPVWDHPTGACGCCGLKAFADRNGTLYVLYRSATEVVHRDIYLLISRDHGQHF